MIEPIVKTSRQIVKSRTKIVELKVQGQESRSLTKGIQILETLSTIPDPIGLSAIAELAGLGKASTLRLLRTLVHSGYLVRDRHDNYSLGRDWPSKEQHSRLRLLSAAAEPFLRQLNAEWGETVALAFLFGDLIRVASVAESTHSIHMSNYPGRVLQPYASSLGKSIVAFQSPEAAQRLLHTYGIYSLTPHTLTDFRAIQEDLAQVRERGYAWDREETVLGGVCVGAPIVVRGGEVFASISMSTPTPRFTREVEALLPGVITGYAARIATALDGAPHPAP
jgi:IclR family transcriptional regulator, acetate operon repressor